MRKDYVNIDLIEKNEETLRMSDKSMAIGVSSNKETYLSCSVELPGDA